MRRLQLRRPLAAFSFMLGFDPFLNMMRRLVVTPDDGVIRACADDVGGASRRLEHLRTVARIFDLARRLAGLPRP